MTTVLLLLSITMLGVLVASLVRRARREPPSEARHPHEVAVEGTIEQVLENSRRAARELSAVLSETGAQLKDGMTTQQVNDIVVEQLYAHNLIPVMRGLNGYPADSNVSVNEEVLHAPPSAKALRSGDVLKIQTSARLAHAFANQGWSFTVDEVGGEARRILEVSQRALLAGIAVIREGARVGDIGHAIQSEIESAGFSVVRDYVGYAMGRRLMEGPQLPCYGRPGTGQRLQSGQLLNVHVIAKAGDFTVIVRPDDWTVAGQPGEVSALFTAMVLVQPTHAEILSSVEIPSGQSKGGA